VLCVVVLGAARLFEDGAGKSACCAFGGEYYSSLHVLHEEAVAIVDEEGGNVCAMTEPAMVLDDYLHHVPILECRFLEMNHECRVALLSKNDRRLFTSCFFREFIKGLRVSDVERKQGVGVYTLFRMIFRWHNIYLKKGEKEE